MTQAKITYLNTVQQPRAEFLQRLRAAAAAAREMSASVEQFERVLAQHCPFQKAA